MSIFKNLMEHPEYWLTIPASRGLLDFVPDKIYLKLLYRLVMKEALDLKEPAGYNARLQYLKLYDRKEDYHRLVDKGAVRDYIENVIGAEYLVPLIGIFSSIDEIPFDSLPDRFVIKCTHDSGSVEVCTDRSSWDRAGAIHRLERALKRDYYSTYREWPYRGIPHRIIVEQYLEASDGDLKDYKVLCFGGKAYFIEIHTGRFNGVHTQSFYSCDWEKTEIYQEGYPVYDGELERPANLPKMLELSEVLCREIPHARIDWYESDGRLYFGEITFYDGSGLVAYPDKWERYLGELIELTDFTQ